MASPEPTTPAQAEPLRAVLAGRYAVFGEIGSGGMATIEYGRLMGPHGFARPVAIKRLHAQFAKDPDFVSMFLDEARLSSQVHHINVIPTLDVIEVPGELALVMEFVHGETLAMLLRLTRARGELVPVRIATTLIASVLHGLHAAHESKSEDGKSLELVHRDVSPHNMMVGVDGVPRIYDFGIAKAKGRMRSTPSGEIKGKLAYMAPEQLRGGEVDRRTDVYGASAVLWEMLTGHTLFEGANEAAIVHAVLEREVPKPSSENPEVTDALDQIVLKGLERDPGARFPSAQEMAVKLERRFGVVTQSQVSEWVQHLAGERLAARAVALQEMRDNAPVQEQTQPSQPVSPAVHHATRKLDLLGSNPPSTPPGWSDRLGIDMSVVRRRLKVKEHPYLWVGIGIFAFLLLLWGISGDPEPPAAVRSEQNPSMVTSGTEVTFTPQPTPEPVRAVPLQVGAQEGSTVQQPTPTAGHATVPRPAEEKSATPSPSGRTRTTRSRTSTSAERNRKRGCDPPYVVDQRGVRTYKPECL